METKAITVEAEEFTGQALPDFEMTHLGVDPSGNPISQGLHKFRGGETIVHHGDYIARFPSGQVVVLWRATWLNEKKPYVIVDGKRIPLADKPTAPETKTVRVAEAVPVAPMGAAEWPAKIVERDVVIPVDGSKRADPMTQRAQTYHATTGWTDDADAPAPRKPHDVPTKAPEAPAPKPNPGQFQKRS